MNEHTERAETGIVESGEGGNSGEWRGREQWRVEREGTVERERWLMMVGD